MATLELGEHVWIPGHSPVSGGRTQLERQIEVRTAIPSPPSAIALHFLVDSYTRRGHYFDMESLGYVVLAAWRHDLSHYPRAVEVADPYRPESIWLTMTATEGEPGLHVAHELPPDPEADAIEVAVDISNPPGLSVRGTAITELDGFLPLEQEPWLGLELSFGPEPDIGEFGFNGRGRYRASGCPESRPFSRPSLRRAEAGCGTGSPPPPTEGRGPSPHRGR
jgi:hypothetical protein